MFDDSPPPPPPPPPPRKARAGVDLGGGLKVKADGRLVCGGRDLTAADHATLLSLGLRPTGQVTRGPQRRVATYASGDRRVERCEDRGSVFWRPA